MRKFAVVLVCLLIAIPLAAQQPEKRSSLYVFISNPSGAWSERAGSSYEGAIGLALMHKFDPHWSAELAVSRQRDHTGYIHFDLNGNRIESREFDVDSTPIDLGAQYHFLNDGSWKPYLGLGARYTDAPLLGEERPGRVLFGVTGGVVWKLRPAFGIRFDGKVLLGDTGRLDRLNGAVGVTWAF